ncbi:uncharacterized protein EAE97_000779 [Botrytis byssoidea]|uniref:Uncharacterized protein n=1 Tax=Botrytis byssoidea TaxID=139641 RepID=A0A9P5M850_9HELO|nr:uncharacterized protein EAE97_000779 [Botrytis byssoidea]KAF7953380.1 hypothetical protein EAE97_000779 [Botrytis byssoidea]
MASHGTSLTGLGGEKEKSSPMTVPTKQRLAAPKTKKTGENGSSTAGSASNADKFGRKPTLETPPSFGGRTGRNPPSEKESGREDKSPSDDGNYTFPSDSEKMFNMSDLDQQLIASSGERTKSKARAAPTKAGSSKAAEPTPAKKTSAGGASAKRLVRKTTLPIENDSDSPQSEPSPQLKRRGTGGGDSSRRETSKERTQDRKKASRGPAKAGGSK